MPSQLPNGRWRPRVRHPRTGKQINPATIVGGPETYSPDDHDGAKRAEDEAKRILANNARAGVTVADFWHEWTTDPLWLRPSESTNLHYRERGEAFVAKYGTKPMRAIDDAVVAEWLRGGKRNGTVPTLRTFFNDAMRPQAGRLVVVNPFAKLGLKEGHGRRDVQPPGEADAARLIALADELTPPSFAAYLDVAIHEGARPGELDALRWTDLDFTPGAETIHIERQWVAKTRTFDLPKHGSVRTIAMTDSTRERLSTLPRESEYVFTTLRGTHYRPSSRSHHWNRVRCAAGLGHVDLYTCTRHHFTWYALNVLGLPPHVIALHLGHRDGGELVRTTYGHPDAAIARERLREAFANAPARPAPIRHKRAA
jgi:integrase